VTDLPQKIRAFVALRVSAEVERAIEDLITHLQVRNDGVKWVSSANLHLTLKFLGPAVPVDRIHRLERELKAIAEETATFELEAVGVGGFPDLKHPQVLWIGLRSDALSDLAARVEDGAARCGFEREQRPFHGHLTIGRLKRSRLRFETRAGIEAVRNRDFGTSKIRAMTLCRSITAPAGPIYEVLCSFGFIA
jgi:2'-5' RNA ligase